MGFIGNQAEAGIELGFTAHCSCHDLKTIKVRMNWPFVANCFLLIKFYAKTSVRSSHESQFCNINMLFWEESLVLASMILIISLPDDNAPYQNPRSDQRESQANLLLLTKQDSDNIELHRNTSIWYHSNLEEQTRINIWYELEIEDFRIIVNGGHKKSNGTFCQNTNAVSHQQTHIKHVSIEIDDTDSVRICLSLGLTKTLCWLGQFISQRFVVTGSQPRPYLSSLICSVFSHR